MQLIPIIPSGEVAGYGRGEQPAVIDWNRLVWFGNVVSSSIHWDIVEKCVNYYMQAFDCGYVRELHLNHEIIQFLNFNESLIIITF